MVWTAQPDVQLRTADGGLVTVANAFTRFDVLGMDSSGLHVRCSRCAAPLEGWIREEDTLYRPRPLHEAVHGTFTEFALALRESALQRDLAALRPVMYERFTFSFGGGGGPADAFSRWHHENYHTLDLLPVVLDHGLATADGVIWSAPPAFVTEEEYRGLRAGFRRLADRWEWLYLVRGD
jgi:hypothetical protein